MSKPINKTAPLSNLAEDQALVSARAANDDKACEGRSSDQCDDGRGKNCEDDGNEPLLQLQELAKQRLNQLLAQMFDCVDDALFALADKAENNSEQSVFFESMRDIRLKRCGIETQCSEAIARSFTELSSSQEAIVEPPEAVYEGPDESEELTLVQNEELEEQVAVDGMVSKFLGTDTDSLRALSQRVDSLMSELLIDEHNNPIGPRAVCNNFMQACRCLEVDIKSKLVVYKLFEKQLMQGLDAVYQQCNEVLIELDVLPGLVLAAAGNVATKQSRLNGSTSASSLHEHDEQQDEYGEAAVPQTEELFALVRQLMAQSQQQETLLAPASAQWFAPGQAEELPRSQLFELLSEAQTQLLHNNAGASSDLDNLVNTEQPTGAIELASINGVLDVHQTMRSLLQARNIVEQRSLPQPDFDAINLVSMLFQFILDDGSLDCTMKAQLARLQIPVLKAAMLDKSFFGAEGHPARQLLNKMATAAIGWVDGDADDPLLIKITESIDALLREFDQNTDVFRTRLQDFDQFLTQESKRSSLLEKRTIDAADGKAKAEQAKAVVLETLADLLAARDVPEVVEQLLREAWSNVMFLSYVREGESSDSWQGCVETASQLICSVTLEGAMGSKESLMTALPGLLRALREGLAQVGFDSFKMNELFSELEKVHLELLSNACSEPSLIDTEATDSPSSLSEGAKPVAISNDVDMRVAETHGMEKNHLAEKGANPQEIDEGISEENGQDQDLDLESMLGSVDSILSTDPLSTDPQFTALQSTADQSTAHQSTVLHSGQPSGAEKNDEEYLDDAPTPCEAGEAEVGKEVDVETKPVSIEQAPSATPMAVGSWIELLDAANLTSRAKLAAVTRPGDRHIFVNRAGMKVLVLEPAELQQRISTQTIKVLEDGALFDRALQSVIGNLRQIKKPEAP